MSTAIDELYNEKHTDFGRLNTPDLRLFTEQSNKKPEILCVDILEHIQNCPVCSKLYTYNNPNSGSKENFKNSKETNEKTNNLFLYIGVPVLLIFIVLIIYLIIKMKNNDRRSRRLFNSPSYRSK
jgi:hypothetical protein